MEQVSSKEDSVTNTDLCHISQTERPSEVIPPESSYQEDDETGILIDIETDYFQFQTEDYVPEGPPEEELTSVKEGDASLFPPLEPICKITFNLLNYFSPYSKGCSKDSAGFFTDNYTRCIALYIVLLSYKVFTSSN